MLHNMIFNTL